MVKRFEAMYNCFYTRRAVKTDGLLLETFHRNIVSYLNTMRYYDTILCI